MNRIILIGNGFDLAHGLKTSYGDFIDWYWKNTIEEIKKCRNEYVDEELTIKSDFHELSYVLAYCIENTFQDLLNSILTYKRDSPRTASECFIFIFKNKFLKNISYKHKSATWVDIENEYYQLLKDKINKVEEIDKLNQDFNGVKCLLEKYLTE